LGTDDLGRDVLSRLIYGARLTLFAGVFAVAVGAAIGIPFGLLAGLTRRRWIDEACMRVIDTMMSFPSLVIAIGIVGAIGPGLTNAMFAIGLTFVPVLARLMRATTLAVRSSLYVEASRVFGARNRHLVLRHILPNAIQPVIVQTALLLATALLAEAALSFLGLGVQPPDPSWGAMLGRAYRFLGRAPLQMLAPGLAIVSVVLAINTLGEAMRAHLDPRSRE
jgi:peptide/nickel transport system permease protein